MLTAIIIDDETRSRRALRQKLFNNCPEVSIIAECENSEEGILTIEEKKPDIVFLDIEMPRMNGFTMLQQLHNRNFELIFITAYDHYAIKAIKFTALDYLLKPVEVEDLKTAVAKAMQKRSYTAGNERLDLLFQNFINEKKEHKRLAVNSFEGIQFINLNDIIYMEAQSNYTIIYLAESHKLIASKTLKHFEDLLPNPMFIRIHQSYLVNKNKVVKYLNGDGGQVIMINGDRLDVARRKKDDFLEAIG